MTLAKNFQFQCFNFSILFTLWKWKIISSYYIATKTSFNFHFFTFHLFTLWKLLSDNSSSFLLKSLGLRVLSNEIIHRSLFIFNGLFWSLSLITYMDQKNLHLTTLTRRYLTPKSFNFVIALIMRDIKRWPWFFVNEFI